MASLSPWITRVGTSTFSRSGRKSVRPNAAMQSSVPFGEAKAEIAGVPAFSPERSLGQ